MARPRGLSLAPFGDSDPLAGLETQAPLQVRYLRGYLADLNAQVVLEEPDYFDRDYLAEYSAFYAKSTMPYGNRCRRLHFFSTSELNRRRLRAAAGSDGRSRWLMRKHYLGFIVVRPLGASPLGRTVLRWYPDDGQDRPPRIVEPSRNYLTHVAGVELKVRGLAWQQQDAGVGACATVALWSALHSSAFDDHHAVPVAAHAG